MTSTLHFTYRTRFSDEPTCKILPLYETVLLFLTTRSSLMQSVSLGPRPADERHERRPFLLCLNRKFPVETGKEFFIDITVRLRQGFYAGRAQFLRQAPLKRLEHALRTPPRLRAIRCDMPDSQLF